MVSVDGGFVTAQLDYAAEPGETNRVTVNVSENGRRVAISDPGATIEAGKRCRIGRDAGEASCGVPKIRDRIEGIPIDFGALLLKIDPRLEDGDDTFDATALPVSMGEGPVETDLATDVAAGDGRDTITTGRTDDVVTPGGGDDVVRTGAGDDSFIASAAVDGADAFAGGPGNNLAAYLRRREDVSLSDDGLANDGAAGEGDQLVSIGSMFGGAGDDSLLGGPGASFQVGGLGSDQLIGAEGQDLLLGDDPRIGEEIAIGISDRSARGGDDHLDGGDGDDFVLGGEGEDAIEAGSGDDYVDSAHRSLIPDRRGKGLERDRDDVDCGEGRDEGGAERLDRLSRCERVRRLHGRRR